MNRWRALARGGRALVHVLRGLWIIRTRFARLTPAQTLWLVREWSRQMLAILGVELVVQGAPPAHGPLLMVSNHISWLDIVVLNAAHPSRFIAKADVKCWPLLGSLITGAGTLYIERDSRRDAMRVVHRMAERLRAGDMLTVFPEGTTSDGRVLLPFHANLLQAAITTQVPVLPLALRFVDSVHGGHHDGPLFVGDTTLLASVWATLCADGVQAQVHYGEPQPPGGRDRRTWAQDLRAVVARLQGDRLPEHPNHTRP